MSSSIGYMKFMEVHMNYYVDLDIVTQHDTYSFQIMNTFNNLSKDEFI